MKTLVRDTPPSDIIHTRLPAGLKDKFKVKCAQKKTNMNAEVVKFIQKFIK